jgi:hypothetical protein
MDDDSHRAALMYQRMTPADQRRTIWVTTAQEAIGVLRDYRLRLEHVFLDHDLGGRTYVHSGREDCGMEVVRFLEKQDAAAYDCDFVVHSWNIPAGKKMTERLNKHGYRAVHHPFGM